MIVTSHHQARALPSSISAASSRAQHDPYNASGRSRTRQVADEPRMRWRLAPQPDGSATRSDSARRNPAATSAPPVHSSRSAAGCCRSSSPPRCLGSDHMLHWSAFVQARGVCLPRMRALQRHIPCHDRRRYGCFACACRVSMPDELSGADSDQIGCWGLGVSGGERRSRQTHSSQLRRYQPMHHAAAGMTRQLGGSACCTG